MVSPVTNGVIQTIGVLKTSPFGWDIKGDIKMSIYKCSGNWYGSIVSGNIVAASDKAAINIFTQTMQGIINVTAILHPTLNK